MLAFHGTTSKGLNSILNSDGLKPCSPWICSDNDGATYVWPLDKLAENEGLCIVDDLDELIERGISQAFESAQIQAVSCEDFDLYVLELEIENDLLHDDFSCENMASVASFIECGKLKRHMIKKVYHYKFNKWFAPILCASLINNKNFNKWALSPELLAISDVLQDSELYLDEVLEIDYQDVTNNYL